MKCFRCDAPKVVDNIDNIQQIEFLREGRPFHRYRFRFLGLIGVDSSIFCLIFQSRHNSWKSLSRSSQSESVSQSVSGDEGAGVTIPGTDQSQPQ